MDEIPIPRIDYALRPPVLTEPRETAFCVLAMGAIITVAIIICCAA